MPQLAKGGKWVFGWCVARPSNEIQIPLEAYIEYGFQQGETAIVICGSKRSGGIGIGRLEKLNDTVLQSHFVGQTTIGADGRVAPPSITGVQPGERLLSVRGSGLALSFLQRGPICEEALNHPEIEVIMVA